MRTEELKNFVENKIYLRNEVVVYGIWITKDFCLSKILTLKQKNGVRRADLLTT